MAGNHYFDLRELGFITYVVVVAVILLEMLATRIKATVR
jgi:phosphonate transport system permease protein